MKDSDDMSLRSRTLVDRYPLFASIRGRMYLLLLSVLIPVVLVQAGYLYERFNARTANEFQANLEIARAVAGTFDDYIKGILHQGLSIGINFTMPHSLSAAEMNQVLEANSAENPAVRSFSWLDPQGRVIGSSNDAAVDLDVSDRTYVQKILSGREWVVSDLLVSRSTGELTFTVSRAIRSREGNLLGIVVAGVSPEKLGDVLSFKLSKCGAVTLIDRQGRAVYRSPDREWSWEERLLLSNHPDIRQALDGREVTGIFPGYTTREDRLMGLSPVPSIGWVASVGRSKEAVMAPILSQILNQAGVFSFLTMIVFLGAFTLSEKFAGSIRRLWEQALAIGGGDLKRRIEVAGPGELKDLASAFNIMAERIEAREKDLKSAWKRLLSVLEAVPASVYLQAPDYSIRFANRTFRETFGDPEGKPCYEVIRGRTEPCEGCSVSRTFNTHTPQQWEWSSPAGKSYSIHTHPLTDMDGSPLVLKLSVDITERKRAEESLKQVRDELETIFHSTPACIWYKDTRNTFIRVNRAAADLVGLGPKEIAGKSAHELFPDTAEEYYRDDLEVIESGRPKIGIVEQARDSSGEMKWVRTDKVPVRDGDGNVTGIIAFSIDITERKRMEDALRESEEKFRSLAESSADCIIRYDREGRHLYANPACARVSGIPVEEFSGRTHRELGFDAELCDAWEERIRKVFDTGEPEQWEFELDGAEGPIYLDWRVVPEFKDGRVVAVLGVSRDITEQKKAENELRSLPTRLLAAQEEERKRIAHELHDSIGGSLSTIKMSLMNTLRLIEDGGVTPKSIEDLVEMTEYTIGEARRIYMHLRPAILDDLGLIATIGWFTRQFESLHTQVLIDKHIETEEKRIPEELKIVIFRVMQETFHNVAKHSKAERVTLSLRETGGCLEFSIADNGVGFEHGQVSARRSNKRGLGLTSMRERVELSRGSFSVESTIGGGTTVHASWNISKAV